MQTSETNAIIARTQEVLAAITMAESEIRSQFYGVDSTDNEPDAVDNQINIIPEECTPTKLSQQRKLYLALTGIGELGHLAYNTMQSIVNTFRENRISPPSIILAMLGESFSFSGNKVAIATTTLPTLIRCASLSSPQLESLYANQSRKYGDMFYDELVVRYNELTAQMEENSADSTYCSRVLSGPIIHSIIRLTENRDFFVILISRNLSRNLSRDIMTLQRIGRLLSLSEVLLNRCLTNNKN